MRDCRDKQVNLFALNRKEMYNINKRSVSNVFSVIKCVTI